MKEAPLPAPWSQGAVPASPIGRATRTVGRDFEVLRLRRADAKIADELLELGREGAGGFVEGGFDGEPSATEPRVWLARRLAGRTLGELFRSRKGPWPWADAVAIGIGVARALAACERRDATSPLAPDGVRVDVDEGRGQGRVTVVATSLVAAMLGEPGSRAKGGSPAWTPPAQADGAPWDAAANRYVLGLMLYRMLSGEHAFGGGGLRGTLGEQAAADAAPFAPAVASALPPGLQSFTLRILAREPSERPADAASVATALRRFEGEGAPPREAGPRGASAILSAVDARGPGVETSAAPSPAPRRRTAVVEGKPTSLVRRFAPLGAGMGIAAAALALLGPAPAGPEATLPMPTRSAFIAELTSAASCAECHPRQANEWRRSVMAHAVRSPLFNGLESLIEEQVGRDAACPGGAGVLRKANPATACKDEKSGLPITGSGGEHWCVNCHAPTEKLGVVMPAWDGTAARSASRRPATELLKDAQNEGVSCTFCHSVQGPVAAHVAGQRPGVSASNGPLEAYEGNATWTSFVTGRTFFARPEDGRGLPGIGNSGYKIGAFALFAETRGKPSEEVFPELAPTGNAHKLETADAKRYLRSSEFCGSCHDVRLFGTDAVGVSRGEHFKRLRNAYSEWTAWAKDQERLGKRAASCQDCHMSTFPGTCEPGEGDGGDGACPPGSHLVTREPGRYPEALAALASRDARPVTTHYFSGVDVPLAKEFAEALVDEATIDAHGIPLSAKRRRDLLLARTFRFGLQGPTLAGDRLLVPVEVENVGAGHRVPAGFSQEREIWVHLVVKDGDGRVVYEVGKIDRVDEDLKDKVFERVNTNPNALDGRGRPVGLFGADVRDGPDVPRWDPPPGLGGTAFRGKGLINFQNGFFRCVRCIGTVTGDGRCEAAPGQEGRRADRFADGDYDLDTGECRSNLSGREALFETYFPVGALDASRGFVKGPDAILDTRSLPPGVPIRYTYELGTSGRRGPFTVEAELMFRAFPPFLIKAFASYEREQAARGLRDGGPLVSTSMLARLELVTVARARAEIAR